MDHIKPVTFLGDSLDFIRELKEEAKREVGHQLDRVQRGLNPDNWKPMRTIGSGVREIRIHEKSGAFRVIYVVEHTEGVFVLHAFQKKTEKTAKHDLGIAKMRFQLFLANKKKREKTV